MHEEIESLLSLRKDRPIILDGAWGTELQKRGLPVGASADSWNWTKQERVQEVAAAYVEAGSEIVLTNTFQANRIALARHGLEDEAGRINRLGVVLSRRAVPPRVRVYSSIGPTGLRPDDISAEKLTEIFREQAFSLLEGNAAGIVIETMTTLLEARCALEAAKETLLPVVVSLTFGLREEPDCLLSGETIEEAASSLEAAGADVIGLNCMEATAMLPLCRRLHAATDLPLWMKPNAGLPEMIDGKPIYWLTPEEFTEQCQQLVDAGASFVGGCCGIGPAHIRLLVETLGVREM
jgi:5-methyltetrahydrofolate--homocysteine methyltransferase